MTRVCLFCGSCSFFEQAGGQLCQPGTLWCENGPWSDALRFWSRGAQTLWPQNYFILFQVAADPKDLLFVWVTAADIYCIRKLKLRKDLFLLNITIIHPLCACVNNMFLWNITPFSKKKKTLIEYIGIVLHFLNLSGVWLHRQHLDFHICFRMQSVVIYYFAWSRGGSSDLTQICHWERKTVCMAFVGEGGCYLQYLFIFFNNTTKQMVVS